MSSTQQDPFGQAMIDYLNGDYDPIIRVDSNITEDEEIPVDYLFRKEKELPEKEKISLAKATGRTLDVGAGSGCHSLLLQEKGVDVTALDYSVSCVMAMEKQGLKKVIHGDFFSHEGKYDTLLFLMNGLGIMGTIDRLDIFFTQCKSLLNPGGQILGESTDILYMFQEEDGSMLVDLNASYYGEMEYKMTYREIEGTWFKWLYVGFELLEEAAQRNGFKVEKLFEGEEHDYQVRFTLLK